MKKQVFSLVTGAVTETEELKKVISVIHSTCNLSEIGEFIIIYSQKSSDNYADFLEGLRLTFPDINFVFMKQTGAGLSNAVRESYDSVRFSHIIGFAADGDNDPSDICKIMELSKKEPQKIITASRRLHKNGFRAYPLPKRIANDLFFCFLRIFFRCRQSDITYFFGCIPAEIFRKHCADEEEKDLLSHICMLPELHGVEFTEFPSRLCENAAKKHTNLGLRYYISTVRGILTQYMKLLFK